MNGSSGSASGSGGASTTTTTSAKPRRSSSAGNGTGTGSAFSHQYHQSASTGTTRTSSPQSVVPEPPLEFDIFAHWPHLQQVLLTTRHDTPYHLPGAADQSVNQSASSAALYYHLAYACLNYRGAIVHGQAIDCTYQVPTENLVNLQVESVLDVWKEAGFLTQDCVRLGKGTTTTKIDDIKRELQLHGPVVSTSFTLDPIYYQSTRHAGNFSERHIHHDIHCAVHHPLLLMGWTMSSQGPVWLVQALRGPTFAIGMGQFGIEDQCWAPPLHLLQQKSWQSPGPFWDVPQLADKSTAWRDYFGANNQNHDNDMLSSSSFSVPSPTTKLTTLLELLPLSSTDIEALADLWTDGVGLHTVITERRTFVLRDSQRMAQSRRVLLRDVARVPHPPPSTHQQQPSSTNTTTTSRVWKVTLSVVRS